MKKIINKIIDYLIQKNNRKVYKEWNDYCFLQELCMTNGTLDIDKYDRLLSMVKRKYRWRKGGLSVFYRTQKSLTEVSAFNLITFKIFDIIDI